MVLPPSCPSFLRLPLLKEQLQCAHRKPRYDPHPACDNCYLAAGFQLCTYESVAIATIWYGKSAGPTWLRDVSGTNVICLNLHQRRWDRLLNVRLRSRDLRYLACRTGPRPSRRSVGHPESSSYLPCRGPFTKPCHLSRRR